MISVIIPTYKNREQLISNLRHNLPFLKGEEVIVVNDFPEENLSDDLQQFPDVTLIQNQKNLGFGGAVNTGVKHATGTYIMLLNSDVLLLNQDYQKALSQFEKNQQLFAISFAQKEKDGSIVGKNTIYWEKGLFQHAKATNQQTGINGWAEGGSCIIDKAKFVELGGFDMRFAPFYWEDIDLSYRALKSGFTVLYDADILVEHHHESTIGKYFSSSHVKEIAYRNQFLFIWKNISDINLKLNHYLWLPYYFIYLGILKGNRELLNGIKKALQYRQNHTVTNHYQFTDHEVLQTYTHH